MEECGWVLYLPGPLSLWFLLELAAGTDFLARIGCVLKKDVTKMRVVVLGRLSANSFLDLLSTLQN